VIQQPRNRATETRRTAANGRTNGAPALALEAVKPLEQSVAVADEFGQLINRELSWLDFNNRVLALAEDSATPLLERAKFLAIFSRNLDEFFQVRVGGLKQQVVLGVTQRSPDGMTPREQLRAIRTGVSEMVARHSRCFNEDVAVGFEHAGIRLVGWNSLEEPDRSHLSEVFASTIFPVLTPLAVDPAHPFPYISNLSLNLAVVVRDVDAQTSHVARIKVPPLLHRFVPLPDGERFVPIEQVIAAHLTELFPQMRIVSHHSFRLTRNADYELEAEEGEDLLEAVQTILEQRRRSPLAVRLEIEAGMTDEVRELLVRELDLEADDVYPITAPLDLVGLWELHELDRADLKYASWTPVTPPAFTSPRGEGPPDIFRVLRSHDVLVQHPYESFEASVEAFVEQAAADSRVLAIKQTLYRTSGVASPIIHALIRAAQSGKQVVALIELTARFDEQANIEWAQMLEDAGVHVVYGIVGLKTHAKLTLVVRQEDAGIRRYCHLGTGNYNPDTARIYEDIGLLTDDQDFGADLSDLFNLLTGYSRQRDYRQLLVAPLTMRGSLHQLIDGEAHPHGLISVKVNSLVDSDVIRSLYRASQAGADVDLLVRGICCLRPGVPGLSDRIRVRSIVGRYLEHSRIYRFGDSPDATYYAGSADLMPRNLDRRLEVLFPVLSAPLRGRVDEILDTAWSDDVLAWELKGDRWSKVPTVHGVNAHERLQQLALDRAHSVG
jgi:polyphosphate kinase